MAVATLAGCSQNTNSEQSSRPVSAMCQSKPMPGGWSVSEITPDSQRAIDTVMSQMNTASPLKQVNEVRTQVVNGVNYAIEFTLENGEVWHAVVYRNLRNDYMIDQVAQQGELCP
ncbi:cystatin domain-containing protein [Vibrio brasiliensis]|nr:cystatin domain-containing protein [Vibrio brasiliensis]